MSSVEPVLFTVRQVARALQVSKRTVFRRISKGEVRVVRLGKLVRVPKEEFDRLVRGA